MEVAQIWLLVGDNAVFDSFGHLLNNSVRDGEKQRVATIDYDADDYLFAVAVAEGDDGNLGTSKWR